MGTVSPDSAARRLANLLDLRRVSAKQISILLLVQLVLMIDGLDVQLLGLVTPVILNEWSLEKSAFGLPLAASLFGLAIGAGVGGHLGDLWGRKRVLYLSAILFGTATFAVGMTNTASEMTVVRFISGLGFGAATPTGMALVAEWFPRKAQARAISFLSIGTPLGGMIGSLALINIIPLLGWRGAFLGCGIVTVMVAIVLIFCLPESILYLIMKGKITEARKLMRKYADIDLSEKDLDYLQYLEETKAPKIQKRIMDRENWRLNFGGWISFFTAQFVAYSFISWAATFLSIAGFTLKQSLQFLFAFNLMAMFAALITGSLITRFGSRKILNWASILTGIFSALLYSELAGSSAALMTARYWPTIFYVAGVGMFAGVSVATNYAVMTLGYDEQLRSTGLGTALMAGRFGGMFAGLIGGGLLSVVPGQIWPYFTILVLMAICTLFGSVIINRHIQKL